MLSTLIHSMMTSSSSQAQNDPDKRVESKNRYPPYNSFVKKIKVNFFTKYCFCKVFCYRKN